MPIESYSPAWQNCRQSCRALVTNTVGPELQAFQRAVEKSEQQNNRRIFVRISQILTLPTLTHESKRQTYHFGSTSASALPPSTPILLSTRLRVVKGLLKNTEIEKIARTMRSGTYLGQYRSVRHETGASRKLLTCLVGLPPEP